MKSLDLKDKAVFEKYLKHKKHNLSAFSFANIFIWKDIFKIFWKIIDEALCVFMQDSVGCFMYLPPLGKKMNDRILNSCFSTMDKLNIDRAISRIENAENDDLELFKSFGLKCKFKANEYLYSKNDLISLSGDRYKSKRSANNYFLRNYDFKYEKYMSKYKEGCLRLYNDWSAQRKAKYNDSIYQRMIDDNYHTILLAMTYYKELDLVGRVIKVDDEIKGYSFGFELNKDSFCVLFEVTDLKIKGLSQYIFRQFTRELNGFSFVNVMDDSGLDNLKKVKTSYHPVRLEPSYLVSRN